jgi:selenocysteine lyase/cysteine desulfurase
VVNKFQRILGLKVPENLKDFITIPAEKKPVVLYRTWNIIRTKQAGLETIADVEVIPSDEDGLLSVDNLAILLEKYKERSFKIASTSCSNVTGIRTPYHAVAN